MSLCIAKIIDGNLFINTDSLISGSDIRRAYNTLPKSNPEQPQSELFHRAFNSVIESDKVLEVGDFQFTVLTTTAKAAGFEKHKFLSYRSFNYIFAVLPLGGTIVSTLMKTPTNEGYAINYVPGKNLLKPALGIHFGHVNYGLLFLPKKTIKPKEYNNVDGVKFHQQILKEEGIDLIDGPLRMAFNNYNLDGK